jgi:undecaprenyl pyrophosphate synthase
MAPTALGHVAVVAADLPAHRGEPGAAVADALARAAATARAAFAAVPALRAFSFCSPAIDRLAGGAPDAAAGRARVDGGRALLAAAVELGAELRLCGRVDGLPAALRGCARPAPPGAERALLWFLDYGGRDEIVRAAGRFLRAHPDRDLADDELDAWLDTAGVPDPDLLIHVGGPLEPHDALLWQGSYAEIWHTPAPWAEFTADDLHRALADYAERQRRFGR